MNGKFYCGIKTGLSEAFVIDEAIRRRLIAEDPKSADLIKSWLRGRNIRKWKAEWEGLYLITIASSANRKWSWSKEISEAKARPSSEKAYPVIHRHLSQYENKLRKRDDQGKFWWKLRSCVYYESFEVPKITWGNLATEPKFGIDKSKTIVSAPAVIIPKRIVNHQAATRSGGFLKFKPMYVEAIPIPSATDAQKAPIIERVRKIFAVPDNPIVLHLETEINRIIWLRISSKIIIIEGRK